MLQKTQAKGKKRKKQKQKKKQEPKQFSVFPIRIMKINQEHCLGMLNSPVRFT